MRRTIPCITLIILLLASAAPWACAASPADYYIGLRKHYGASAPVDYAKLRTSIQDMAGRVVEVRGAITGIAESGDSCTYILGMGAQGESLTIVADRTRMPDLCPGTRLRVLVKIPDGAFCITSLEMVALIEEYAIAPRDPKPAPKAAPKPVVVASAPTQPAATTAQKGTGSRAQRNDVTARGGAEAVLAAYRNAVRYFNRRLTESQADAIARHVLTYSSHYGLDARLVMAVIAVESGFNPSATSRAGAMGLAQLMPGTARGLGVSNAYNAEQSVAGATRLIRGHLEKFQGKPVWEQITLAMACYNAGSGAVRKYGGVPPYRETQAYVKKVASLYKRFLGVK